MPTREEAVYGKLRRIPISLSTGFFEDVSELIRPLLPTGHAIGTVPASLAGMTVVVLDGKKIKNAAKRLLATRGRPGKLFGGKILAVYLPAYGLVVAMAADPDGEANDIRLMPRVMPQARTAVAGPRLWVADAQFCDLDQAAEFTKDDDHFLMRFTLRNSFTADPDKAALTGPTAGAKTTPHDPGDGWARPRIRGGGTCGGSRSAGAGGE